MNSPAPRTPLVHVHGDLPCLATANDALCTGLPEVAGLTEFAS